jgi:hypothetical protein
MRRHIANWLRILEARAQIARPDKECYGHHRSLPFLILK